MQIQLTSEITEPYSTTSVICERAKRARHSQVCSIENRGYIYILLASERSERDTLRSVQLRIADIYIYNMYML